jgi:small-conductance mechanosensitive channel
MTNYEIALAEIHLKAVEERIVLSSEARRLREASSRRAQTEQTEEQALNLRIATVEAENRTLQQDLAEAQEKLDAITNIERSIRDQEQ